MAFGCSYTAGHGIHDTWDDKKQHVRKHPSKYAWPAQVGNLLNVEVINNAIGGASNKEILASLLSFDFLPTDLVLINWSYIGRSCIIGDNGVMQIMANDTSEFFKAYRDRYFLNEDLLFETNTSVMLANLYIESKNIKMYQLFLENEWNDLSYVHDVSYMPPAKIIPVVLDTHRQPFGCDNGHPSLETYTEYANEIYTWLITNDNELRT